MVLLGLWAAVSGCSGTQDGKYKVSGSISWKGTPVETGFITFHPSNGKAPEAGRITNGLYTFRAFPGESRVTIQAAEVIGFDKGMNQAITKEYIPAKYNKESEMRVDVLTEGENRFDFSLIDD